MNLRYICPCVSFLSCKIFFKPKSLILLLPSLHILFDWLKPDFSAEWNNNKLKTALFN